jgi:hypothetical protein
MASPGSGCIPSLLCHSDVTQMNADGLELPIAKVPAGFLVGTLSSGCSYIWPIKLLWFPTMVSISLAIPPSRDYLTFEHTTTTAKQLLLLLVNKERIRSEVPQYFSPTS